MTVGHDRQVGRGAVHPLGSAQLGQRLGVVTRCVRRLAGGLAHHRQARCARSRGQGVLVGGLGVGVDQQAGGRQVSCDARRQLLRKSLELAADGAVEFGAGDLLGDGRPVVGRLVDAARLLLFLRPGPVNSSRGEREPERAPRSPRDASPLRPPREESPRRSADEPRPPAADREGRALPPPDPRAGRALRRSSATGGHLLARSSVHCAVGAVASLAAEAAEATRRWPLR